MHASAASFNNHWGVPLTLARMAADTDYADLRDRHEPSEGEIRPLVKLVRPHVAIVTLIAAAHLGLLQVSWTTSPRPRRRSSKASSRTALRCINRDDDRWSLLAELAREAGVEKIVGFGENAQAAYRLTNV